MFTWRCMRFYWPLLRSSQPPSYCRSLQDNLSIVFSQNHIPDSAYLKSANRLQRYTKGGGAFHFAEDKEDKFVGSPSLDWGCCSFYLGKPGPHFIQPIRHGINLFIIFAGIECCCMFCNLKPRKYKLSRYHGTLASDWIGCFNYNIVKRRPQAVIIEKCLIQCKHHQRTNKDRVHCTNRRWIQRNQSVNKENQIILRNQGEGSEPISSEIDIVVSLEIGSVPSPWFLHL